MKFKSHVKKRATQALQAFFRITRLANINHGLSSRALRQLYLACIASIADYGSVVWWRQQKNLIQPLITLQNKALRLILGVFRTAPIPPMEAESALASTDIRLDANTRQYAFRIIKLSPDHPIRQTLQTTSYGITRASYALISVVGVRIGQFQFSLDWRYFLD